MFSLIWKCWFLRIEENRSTLYLKRNKEGTHNKLNTHLASTPGFMPGPHWWEPSSLTTAPPLLPLLKTSDNRCFITKVIVPHRDGVGVLLRCQSQSHFVKWQINIKLFFFSVKTIARSLGKMYHSLTAGHLQLDESVRLTLGNTMFLYVINHSL